MKTKVTFKSQRFHPVLPDESQVNPGCYGAELAFWLCTELAKKGLFTSYPDYEDWGWFIEYISDTGDEFWLGCGNMEGSQNVWVCFLEPKGSGFLGLKKAVIDKAAPFLIALAEVLEEEASISDIEWLDK